MITREPQLLRVSLYIVEIIHYGSGCGNLIADLSVFDYLQFKPFVCHSTPHTDSTSREAPTLFLPIIHEK